MAAAEQILEEAVRGSGDRLRTALAARLRDFDLAEEAFAQACAAALIAWRRDGAPRDPPAWLYAAARRRAFDLMRRAKVRRSYSPDEPSPPPTPEEVVIAAFEPIPDERLRMIFVCCHPALSEEARVALTLRTLCGLTPADIARAFLTTEAAIVQRLTRARRKIRDAAIPYEVPTRDQWGERLNAVLIAQEIAYAQAYERADPGAWGELGEEVLRLSALLVELLPDEPEVLGFAALVRLAEARRTARCSPDGRIVPLADQDVSLWDRGRLAEATDLLARAAAQGRTGPYQLLAAIHAAHASRCESGLTPWSDILTLYDALVLLRPGAVTEIHRALARLEVEGPDAAWAALEALDDRPELAVHAPWRLARAHIAERAGRISRARAELDQALPLLDSAAEQRHVAAWRRRLEGL